MNSPFIKEKSNDLDQLKKAVSDQMNDQFIETIFNVQKQNEEQEPQKEQKQRVRYTEKLSRIYYLYLKLIMGRELNDDEDEEFLEYMDHRSTEKGRILKMKKSFEYVDEFDYHMGDVILRLFILIMYYQQYLINLIIIIDIQQQINIYIYHIYK